MGTPFKTMYFIAITMIISNSFQSAFAEVFQTPPNIAGYHCWFSCREYSSTPAAPDSVLGDLPPVPLLTSMTLNGITQDPSNTISTFPACELQFPPRATVRFEGCNAIYRPGLFMLPTLPRGEAPPEHTQKQANVEPPPEAEPSTADTVAPVWSDVPVENALPSEPVSEIPAADEGMANSVQEDVINVLPNSMAM